MAFKFNPLEPEPISGPQVLEQIEAAITEIQAQVGDISGEWGELIQRAIDTANQALAAAQQAVEAANNAQTSADNAQVTANQALQDAQTALQNASDALAAAQEALQASQQNAADITLIQNDITTINETLTSLQQQIDTLNQILGESLADLLSQLGTYQYEDATVDLNNYTTPTTLLLAANDNANIPDDAGTGNAFFLVNVDNENTAIVQYYTLVDGDTYQRFGAFTSSGTQALNIAIEDTDNSITYTLTGTITYNGTSPVEINATVSDGEFDSVVNGNASIIGSWILSIIENGTVTINDVLYGNIADGVLPISDDVNIGGGTLSGISFTSTEDNAYFSFNFSIPAVFGDWSIFGASGEGGLEVSKATILSLLNISGDNGSDINQLFGYNGHARTEELGDFDIPLTGPGNAFIYSDSDGHATTIYVKSDDGQSVQRTGTYELVFTAHNSLYDVTLNNGTNSYTCTLVYNAFVGNDVRFGIQFSTNGFTMPGIAENGSLVITNILNFVNADADFAANGYTLNITAGNGTGTEDIDVSVAADGSVTVNNYRANFSTYSYLTLLSGVSGEVTENGFEASISLSATNTDYGGSGDWGEWINPLSGITGGLNFIDTFDASAGDYSAITSASAGDFYVISVAGTIGTIEWAVGDWLIVDATTSTTPTEAQIRQVSFPSAGGGTLTVEEGGTGATTLTGIVRGNGTSPFTAATPDVDYTTPATTSGINTRLITAESTLTTKANQSDLTSLQGTVNGNTTKLNGIADGAQVNVIEAITFNGTAATISGKTAQISAPAITIASTEPSATDGNNGDIWIVT